MKKIAILILFAILFAGIANAATMLSENFNDGVADDWTVAFGTWDASTGRYVGTVGPSPLGGNGAGAYYAGGLAWTNAIIEADVYINLTGNPIPDMAIRVNPALLSGYSIRVQVGTGFVFLNRMDPGGGGAALASIPYNFTAGQTYHILLSAIGTTISAYIDGQLVGNVTDATYAGGTAALIVSGGVSGVSTRTFDNIIVTDNGTPDDKTVTGSLPVGDSLTDTSGTPIGGTTTESIVQIRDSSGNVLAEFYIIDDIDLSDIVINSTATRTFVDFSASTAVAGTHSLTTTNTNGAGVYVCPDAGSLDEVDSTACVNQEYFSHQNCVDVTTKSGLTCSIVGGDYEVSGLVSSGLGEGCTVDADCIDPPTCDSEVCSCQGGICVLGAAPLPGEIPEFSTIGIILALVIAALGIAFVIKKRK